MTLINKEDSIYIAGSSGMVGSAITRKLTSLGYKNLLLPNRNRVNLLDFKTVSEWFEMNKPKIVILAAAKVGGINANSKYQADFILENLKIQTNVIESAWRSKVSRFLFLGSSCIYPKFANQPIVEDELLAGKLEKTNSAYAIAKIAGIKLCASLKTQYNFDAISLMPTNLYGPKDNYSDNNSHVMPSLIKKFFNAKKLNHKDVICWGSGEPKREFLHVDDLADAALFTLENIDSNNDLLLDQNKEYSGILNIGTGKDITIKELAIKISKAINFQGNIIWDKTQPDGTPRKLLNISKIRDLGWEPKISLDNGIKNTIKSFIKESENKIIRE